MMTPTSQIANTSCADLLLDLVAFRLSWLTLPQLIEIATQAGFRATQVRTQIRRCSALGLLYRGVRNAPQAANACCWFDSRRPTQVDSAIQQFVANQASYGQLPAEVTELIGIGPVAAGLLGVTRPIEPNYAHLVAAQRLATAFKKHLANGLDPERWQQLHSRHFLAHLAAVALVSSPCGTVKRLVLAPIPMNPARLTRFIKKASELQVPYELW